MELISIGILFGAVITMLAIMIGVLKNDRTGKGKCNDGCSVHHCATSGDRNRCGDNGCVEQMDAEEVIDGLFDLRMALSRQEREYLDYALNCVLTIQKLQRMVDEGRLDVDGE